MKKIIAVSFLVILLGVLFLLFPPFYFNELESEGKPIFNSIESSLQASFDNIEQRSGREGGIKTAEEYDFYTGLINENMQKKDSLITEHQNILNQQGRLAIVLPSKYKAYYGLKKEMLGKYYTALRNYKLLKESETAIHLAWMKQDKFVAVLSDIGQQKDISLDFLLELIEEFETSKAQVNNYFEKKLMTEPLNKKLNSNLDYFIDTFKLVIDWKERKMSDEDFGTKLKELGENKNVNEVVDLIDTSRVEITNIKAKEWSDLYRKSIELLAEANEYYDENKLADDNMSKILSKFSKNYPRNKQDLDDTKTEEKYVDLDGDGQQEVLKLIVKYVDEENSEVSLIAYDKDNKEIGRLPDMFPIKEPMFETARVHTPVKADKKQFVSYEFIAGPHSSETMFFGLFELKDETMGILPVCLTLDVLGASDCLFWSGQVGSLIAEDFDKDGVLEVVEMVDEYPADGQLTEEIENTTKDKFSDFGQEVSDDAISILKREQGGRGNRVVWNIYRYADFYFEEQLDEDYDKYYVLVKDYMKSFYPSYPTIMKKSEISKDSLEYNELMRDFWTGR